MVKLLTEKMNQDGFTFIEVMVALVVVTIGILSLNAMQVAYLRGNETAGHLTMASTWNSDLLENVISRPYDDPVLNGADDPLEDVDLDGTDQDTNGDGIDDIATDLEFGLNDIGGDADHNSAEHLDIMDPALVQLYTVYWNIAVNQPVPNTKTIRAIVVRNSDGVTLAIFDTYKADL